MRFNGELLMLGFGGILGKIVGDALRGALAGWIGIVVQFFVGGFSLGVRAGGPFMTGFGVVNIAEAVGGALNLLGMTLPTLAVTPPVTA